MILVILYSSGVLVELYNFVLCALSHAHVGYEDSCQPLSASATYITQITSTVKLRAGSMYVVFTACANVMHRSDRMVL